MVLDSSVLIFACSNLLADKYMLSNQNKMTDVSKDGFGCIPELFGYSENTRNDILPAASTLDESRFMKMGR
jgi:RNA polymerase II C-terminal domain phosphatase-like 1/2